MSAEANGKTKISFTEQKNRISFRKQVKPHRRPINLKSYRETSSFSKEKKTKKPFVNTRICAMDLGTRPFIISQTLENNNYEYLGSDGVPILESYELYLEKCAEFKAKAKKYARDNESLKKSIIHHEKFGYEGADEMEILLEREQQRAAYEKAFEFKVFDEDSNAKYECFTGKGKRIRIIRELGEEEEVAEFSKDFDEKRSCWFSRYCTLSRFIQIARVVIIQNRLKKNLEILKSLTREKVNNIEQIMARERGESVDSIVDEPDDKTRVNEKESYYCSCNALKEKK